MPRQGRGGTVQRVQDVVRDAIVRLELPPGTAIDKAALCARLGVSRFPVSEALGRLAAEGFVEVLPQRGTRVARIDLADCRQAMFIRRALEAEAMRAIAPRADAGLLAALDRNLREQEAALGNDHGGRFHELDLELHELLLDFLGFERVKHAVEAARAQPRPGAAVHVHAGSARFRPSREHRGDRRGAQAPRCRTPPCARWKSHLDAVMTELVDFAGRNPDAVAEPRARPRRPDSARRFASHARSQTGTKLRPIVVNGR